MIRFSTKFIALLGLDAATILCAAALLLRNHWQPAMILVALLFIANVFLVPTAPRPSENVVKEFRNSQSKVWVLGLALLIAAIVRLGFMAAQGFSWPAFAGVIAGVLLGALFLFIAKKGSISRVD